jgi:glutathione synthase/RimK-type ligase-like ATP-grasp enzyme
MIVIYGIPSEPPLALVINELHRRNIPHIVLNQRKLSSFSLELTFEGALVGGTISDGESNLGIEEISGIYARPTYHRFLPEYWRMGDDPTRQEAFRRADSAMTFLLNNIQSRVLNRPRYMFSNISKPFQSIFIRECGFLVPDTLITNNLAAARDFRARVQRVICKAISGERTIVRTISEEDLTRIEGGCIVPIQLQEYIAGTDIRVHVVGDRTYPCAVFHEGIDYRDPDAPKRPRLKKLDSLPSLIGECCVSLCRKLNLPLAGIDLRVTPTGDIYCFEVNPNPGYSYYEIGASQSISGAIVDYLKA